MTTRRSISFDRAAGYYDKTRGLTPEAAAKVRDLLVGELTERQPVLEVGVGTGRIALPLADAGIELVGIDLARKMLDRLIENAGGHMPFPVAQADATRLPFQDGNFRAAYASWVLHLVPAWREVVSQMVRVLGTGGTALIDVGGRHQGDWTEIIWHFRDAAGVTDWPPGANDYDEVDEAFGSLGATPRDLEPVVEVTDARYEDSISLLEQGVFSVAFGLDAATRTSAAQETREWAARELGDVTEVRRFEAVHTWRAYDVK